MSSNFFGRSEPDAAYLLLASWLQRQAQRQEAKFPHLVALKAAVREAGEAYAAATTDEEREAAVAREGAACYALLTSISYSRQ